MISRFNKLKVALLFICSLVACFVATTTRGHAVSINESNIPTEYKHHNNANLRMCREDSNSLLHGAGQTGWISLRNEPTKATSFVIEEDQNSLNLQVNVLSRLCTVNISGNSVSNAQGATSTPYPAGAYVTPNTTSGSIVNKALKRTRYNITSESTTRAGIGISSITGTYIDNVWANAYGSPELYYVKDSSGFPEKKYFSLTNLTSLPAGVTSFKVQIRTRAVNRYHSDTSGGTHICVSGGGDTSDIAGSNCTSVLMEFTVNIDRKVDRGICNVKAPASVKSGATFTATFTVKNTGTVVWPVDTRTSPRYRLGSINPIDNTRWGTNRLDIPGNTSGYGDVLRPGQSKTFTRSFTAPTVTSNQSYSFGWRIVYRGDRIEEGTTGTCVDPIPIITDIPKTDSGYCRIRSAPTIVEPGEEFDATFFVKNNGDFDWPVGEGTGSRRYKLGDPIGLRWGVDRVELPGKNTASGKRILAGGEYEFDRTFTAPATTGTYTFRWRIVRDNPTEWQFRSPEDICETTIQVKTDTSYCQIFYPKGFPSFKIPINEEFNVRIRAYNRSGTNWQRYNTNGALLHRLKTMGNSKAFDVVSYPDPPGYDTVADGDKYLGLPINTVGNGGSTLFEFRVRAPSTPTTYNFAWQMNERGVGEFGKTCQVPVEVYERKNQPYVRATSGDIWSGAMFQPSLTEPCEAYTEAAKSGPSNAQINTYTKNEVDRYMYAHMFVKRMHWAMLGRNAGTVTIFNGSGKTEQRYWADRLLDTDATGIQARRVAIVQEMHEYWQGLYASGSTSVPAAFLNNSRTNDDFVNQLFTNAVSRAAGTDLATWTGKLTSGSTRYELIEEMSRSSELSPYDFNSDTSNYGGSGSDYGVFSTGRIRIDDFNWGRGMMGRNGQTRALTNSTQFDMTFSNVADESGQEGIYGSYGYYYSQPLCMPNYYELFNKQSATQSASSINSLQNLGTGSTNVIKLSGDQTLQAPSAASQVDIPAGSKTIVLVDGNVTLTTNVVYASAYGSSSAMTIPSLTMIVKGNIIIHGAVTQLDGIYIAQPNVTKDANDEYSITANTGLISTCQNPDADANKVLSGPCSASQLLVNGSLVAQKLRLYRSFGSTGFAFGTTSGTAASTSCLALNNYTGQRNSSTTYRAFRELYALTVTSAYGSVNKCAAERANLSPEYYLSQAFSDDNFVGTEQSFLELPPVY